MGAEIGATTSLFAYDDAMAPLPEGDRARGRSPTPADAVAARPAGRRRGARRPRPVLRRGHRDRPRRRSQPLINGPHTPDLARPVGRAGRRGARPTAGPLEITAAADRLVHQLVATRTSPAPPSIARQAAAAGLTRQDAELLITPGSEQVRATIERDGLLADLEAIGATVLANACGPCIGQWARTDVHEGDVNTIVTSLQPQLPQAQRRLRQHPRLRHLARDGGRAGPGRHARLQPRSPTRSPTTPGEQVAPRRRPSARSSRQPGFDPGESGFVPPRRRTRIGVEVVVCPDLATGCSCSSRSPPWDGQDFIDLPVLVKAKGKCTTDHISAAGPWLQVPRPPREHLGQPLPRRRQRLHRRGRHRARTSSTASTKPLPGHRPPLPRGRRGLGRRRRRELRRGLLARARGHGAPLPRRQGDHRAGRSPASTRPTSRSRACCR